MTYITHVYAILLFNLRNINIVEDGEEQMKETLRRSGITASVSNREVDAKLALANQLYKALKKVRKGESAGDAIAKCFFH
jgi:hypothetical protein